MSNAKKITMIVMIVAVAVSAVLLSPLGKTRKLDTDYALTFDGTTAICTATVTGERKNDSLQVTMQLKQDDTVLKIWYQEGDFQVVMEETCEGLTKGKVYTLEISAVINGDPQPVVTAKRTCPGGTTPTTKPTTPTTAPTTPTTQPTVPVITLPAVPPITMAAGIAFVYKGPQYVILAPDWRPENAFVNHLYWVDKTTKEYILICNEPIYSYAQTDTHIFFVKESAPAKIYATAIGDFENHQLFYESTYGNVDYMTIVSGLDGYLQFVGNHKKFVVLDMATGESTVLMEQHHIDYGYMPGTGDGVTWANYIWFQGKPTENDPPYLQYFYYRDTGKIEEDDSL